MSETAQRQDLSQLSASGPDAQPSPHAQCSLCAQPSPNAQPSPHAQPSPVPTSPSGSQSSGSVSSQSPSQHSSSPGSLTDQQNDSNPRAHPPAHSEFAASDRSQSPASTHTHSSASTHTQSTASTHTPSSDSAATQSSASTHTQSPGSAGRQSSVSDSPERPSEQARPESSLTEQSVQSPRHTVQDTAGDPEQPPSAAQELAHENQDGPGHELLASAPTPQSSSETSLDTHSKEVAEQGKAAAVPQKFWQSSNAETAVSASQPATAPFWQRQSRDADLASSQPAAVPSWLRKDAVSAKASDDTASVMSEPAGHPFLQRDSTPAAKAASDSGSVTSESGAGRKRGSADTAQNAAVTASVASDGAVGPFWQRANGSTVRTGASDTASVQSGPAPVPFWQRQGSTDTATSQPAAGPFWQKADSSAATATSQPSTAPFWQSRDATSDTAASASAQNLPSWQNMQTGTAAPLTSQASSIASSSRGSGLGVHAMASTAQRALSEGRGSSPASSRAPLQFYSGNANPVAAGSSPSNSQVSDIARLQAQAMRRSGVLRRHVGDCRTGSSLGSPTGSVASVATSGWPDTPSSNR